MKLKMFSTVFKSADIHRWKKNKTYIEIHYIWIPANCIQMKFDLLL